MRYPRSLSILVLLAAAACSSDSTTDASVADSTVAPDVSASTDAGQLDSAAAPDAEAPDASAPDASPMDADPLDAGFVDADPLDADSPDTFVPDADPADAGFMDAEPPPQLMTRVRAAAFHSNGDASTWLAICVYVDGQTQAVYSAVLQSMGNFGDIPAFTAGRIRALLVDPNTFTGCPDDGSISNNEVLNQSFDNLEFQPNRHYSLVAMGFIETGNAPYVRPAVCGMTLSDPCPATTSLKIEIFEEYPDVANPRRPFVFAAVHASPNLGPLLVCSDRDAIGSGVGAVAIGLPVEYGMVSQSFSGQRYETMYFEIDGGNGCSANPAPGTFFPAAPLPSMTPGGSPADSWFFVVAGVRFTPPNIPMGTIGAYTSTHLTEDTP